MAIVITVARDASAKLFAEIERFAVQVTAHEENFKGRLIVVTRGAATTVSDDSDPLRAALLKHMVDALVKFGA